MAKTLSQKVDAIAHQCKGRREMTVQEVLELLGQSGPPFVTLILALPFVLFIPLPGLSILFGVIIFVLGIRMALHKNLWLPKWIKQKKISGDRLAQTLAKTIKFLKKIDKYIHPRGTIYQHHPLLLTLNGWGLAVCGFLLMLPLPPGTNFLPGVAAFLLSLGLLQEDILLMVVGYTALAINLALFVLIPLFLLH